VGILGLDFVIVKPNNAPFMIAWLLLFLGTVTFLVADESNYLAVTISALLMWLGVLGTGLGVVYQSSRFSPTTRVIGWMLLAICAIPAVWILANAAA
jgi:hypothetical protein